MLRHYDDEMSNLRIVIPLACLAIFGAVSASSAGAQGQVWLNDPGLVGLAKRPTYISYPMEGQVWQWVTHIRWDSWGGDTAKGRGTWEKCTFGRCQTAVATVTLSRLLPPDCPTGASYTQVTVVTPKKTMTIAADRYICEND